MIKSSLLTRLLPSLVLMGSSLQAYADEGTWLGYYTGEEALCEFGTGITEDYNCAIYLGGKVGFASGKSIQGMRFTLQGVSDISDLKVWISSDLPSSPEGADLFLEDVELAGVEQSGAVEVSFDSPFWLPDGGAYMGYSFSSKEPFPVMTTPGDTSVENGFYLKTSKTYKEWKDMSQFGNGNLALQLLVGGEVFSNAVSVQSLGEHVAYAGEDVTIPVTIVNYGLEGVKTIEYTIEQDGVVSGPYEHTLHHYLHQIKDSASVNLDFKSSSTTGVSYITFNLVSVNGEANEMEDMDSAKGALVTIEESAPRCVVMEEYTGTWCGWCPRGMVALENLEKDFGDSFLGIAVHFNDPMEIADYSKILSTVPSFPDGRLDRTAEGDPFFGMESGLGNEPSYGIKEDILKELAKPTPALLTVNSVETDAATMSYDITASLSLMYDRKDNPDYSVAFVVVADSLCGDSPSWFQNNDFALPMAQGYKDDPYLGWLTEAGQSIRGLKYNDVAVAAFDIDKGVALEGEGPWTAGEMKVVATKSITLEGNRLVQDINNVRVAALLLDNASGKIVNGADVRIDGTSAVDEIFSDSEGSKEIMEIYTLAGKKLRTPAPGINIVRYTDGSVKKIIIK